MRQVGTHLDNATGSLLAPQPSEGRTPQADARKARIKTLPPPPPLAAFVQRVERPAVEAPASVPSRLPSLPSQHASLPVLPRLAQSPNSDWTELASSHFGSSVRAPKPQARPWRSILALGLGAASVLGAGFSVGLARHNDQTASARASLQRSALAYVAPSHPALLASTSLAAAQPLHSSATALPAPAPVSQPVSAVLKATNPAPARVLPPTAASAAPPEVASQTLIERTPSAHPSQQLASVVEPKAELQAEDEPSATSPESGADVAPGARASAEPAENLPELPSRDDIKRSFEALRPALEACSAAAHGTTFANVTISGDGHVSYSTIEGAFVGSPQGSCMARALRSASFPRFATASLKVRFPFVL
jgi:hypothetical protein